MFMVLGGVSAQSLVPAHPDMECGQMLYKKASSITMEIKNNSNTSAAIKGVDSGCGCTTVNFDSGILMPGQSTQLTLTFDNKQLGHFSRTVRVYDTTSDTPSEFIVRGQVVTKLQDFSGDYPYKLGVLLSDANALEFDDVNQGQQFVKDIHIMNPTGQNLTPQLLRLPSYLKAEMIPSVLAPKQEGTMRVTLKSKELRDFGLIQTNVYLAKNGADKISEDKMIPVSVVLLPPKQDVGSEAHAFSPKMVMSAKSIDLAELREKSKAKDEITITNEGRTTLEFSKVQMFTMGLQVELGKTKLEPGETTKLKVSAKAKELKKVRTRPRILIITNDPNNQKVVLEVMR